MSSPVESNYPKERKWEREGKGAEGGIVIWDNKGKDKKTSESSSFPHFIRIKSLRMGTENLDFLLHDVLELFLTIPALHLQGESNYTGRLLLVVKTSPRKQQFPHFPLSRRALLRVLIGGAYESSDGWWGFQLILSLLINEDGVINTALSQEETGLFPPNS